MKLCNRFASFLLFVLSLGACLTFSQIQNDSRTNILSYRRFNGDRTEIYGVENNLQLIFRVCGSRGLLLYQEGKDDNFFAVSFYDGLIYVEWRTGNDAAQLKISAVNLQAHTEYSLDLHNLKDTENITALIDGKIQLVTMVMRVLDGFFDPFYLTGDLYLGGYKNATILQGLSDKVVNQDLVCIDEMSTPDHKTELQTADNTEGNAVNCMCDLCDEFCRHNPCLNGGKCRQEKNFCLCICPLGYFGSYCESRNNTCSFHRCLNNGTCEDTRSGPHCNCPSGYTGSQCEKRICNNGWFNGSDCVCESLWEGPFCNVTINPCRNHHCQNGASCKSENQSYICTCSPGYVGRFCEILTEPCKANLCPSTSLCLPVMPTGYVCMCQQGFPETNCSKKVSDCSENNPCQNEAACTAFNDGYVCNCTSLTFGPRCEWPLPCKQDSCKNGGTCINNSVLNKSQCICPEGFLGSTCDKIDVCFKNSCLHNSTCKASKDLGVNYVCECQPGYLGERCEKESFCFSNPCHRGSTCIDGENNYSCKCPKNYYGRNCEKESFCFSNPCLSGGTCIDGENNYSCKCPKNYFGRNCENFILTCDPNPCKNNGRCKMDQNLTRNATCECPSQFTGDTCEEFISPCRSLPCKNNASCVESTSLTGGPVGFVCICLPGYVGERCDEMISSCISQPCFNNGVCQDIRGNYVCECLNGLTGKNCEVILGWCDSFPCQNGGTCHDRRTQFTCECATGYTGQLCENRNGTCNIANPCLNNSTCHNTRDGYQCICQPGTYGNSCEHISDPCKSLPCRNNATCISLSTTFKCDCLPGYGGSFCENKTQPIVEVHPVDDTLSSLRMCVTNPCGRNGYCTDLQDGFHCDCLPGFTGKTCSKLVLGCASFNPCHNGGTCQENGNSTMCICPNKFTGPICDVSIGACQTINECMNGGTCTVQGDIYSCICAPGFVGRNCEAILNACYEQPCKNGGRCHYQTVCSCPEVEIICGWQNETCQRQECFLRPNCNINLLPYECDCSRTGYEGDHCDMDIDECKDVSRCQNSGTCININGSYSCLCAEHYSGQKCEVNVDECHLEPNRCQNGGTCQSGDGKFNCICTENYTGIFCEKFDARVEGLLQTTTTTSNASLPVIVGLPVIFGALILLAILVAIVWYVRKNRRMSGKYRPSDAEQEAGSIPVALDLENEEKLV